MKKIDKKIQYQAYLNREHSIEHHRYNEELGQYLFIKSGQAQEAAKLGREMFTSNKTGTLSKDKVREKKYLFVASTTLATRFAIQGGMPEMDAFNTSDVYIQEVDTLNTVDDIVNLHSEMLISFAEGVQKQQKKRVQNLPITLAINYIENHLHESISLEDLAANVGYSEQYLSSLFHSEMKTTIRNYIAHKKIQVAQNMLASGNFSIIDISEILAFSSQSYFTKTFKKYTGQTPKAFQKSLLVEAIKEKEDD